jgi:secreted PhoX family phosphatase
MIRRREFLQASAMGTGALAFGPAFWRGALAAPATEGAGPYGPLQPADGNGIMLPEGFSSRAIAQGGQTVPGTSYQWHIFSDGQATYSTDDGGFILVSNSENPPDIGVQTPGSPGGASAIRFQADGSIADAYRILSGTRVNCAGGATPWGTWLSCEEHDTGQVWECDPTGQAAAVAHPAMGLFEHEAVAVDPDGRCVYLSEDDPAGGFYRFTPDDYPDLAAGTLEVAKVGEDGLVEWARVPDPSAASAPTREQVQGMTVFNRGEGIWFDSGTVYLCTTNDEKIHTYDTETRRMDVLYDAAAFENPPLTNVDNVMVSRSGDLFVCEDTDDPDDPGFDIGLITPDRKVSRFLKVTGSQHQGAGGDARSELTGVIFDPSGERMFFASQRGFGTGVIYEITGPFRQERPAQGGIRVTVPRRIRKRRMLRRGIPVTIVTDEAIRVRAKVTADLPAMPGDRRTRLARVRRRQIDEAGRHKVRLRPRKSKRFLVRRERAFRARVTVVVTDAAGKRHRFRRSIRVARGPKKR